MNRTTQKYFSHSYELNVEHIPTKASDRLAFRITLPGMLLGLVFIAIGVFDYLFRNNKGANLSESELVFDETLVAKSFLNPTFFDFVIVAIGVWTVLAVLASYIRYRKIKFDGNEVEVINRPAVGTKYGFKEDIKNFEGVLFRVEFFQFGIFNKNRYILELAHIDPKKNIPLYISISGKDIRKKWKKYAKTLSLPALIVTNEGVKSFDVNDLNKPLIALVKEGKIDTNFDIDNELPPAIVCAKKKDKTVVKVKKFLWDEYNIISWMGIIVFGSLLCASIYNNPFSFDNIEEQMFSVFHVILFLGLIASVIVLFRKDKIVIKKQKLIIIHKFVFFSRKKYEVDKDKIESIEVVYSPMTERDFLIITSDDKPLVFGKKLPYRSLNWVRKFLIKEIVQ